MGVAVKVIELCEDYSFASTQFTVPKKVEQQVKSLQKEVDKDDWAGHGKEDEIHLTLLYGITGGLSSKTLIKDFISKNKAVEAELWELEVFSPKDEDFDVLVLRVKSQELHSLRRKIESEIPNKQTYPEYKPHITIGYMKKGSGKKYLDLSFEPLSFTLDTVQYSTKGGKKTDLKLIQK